MKLKTKTSIAIPGVAGAGRSGAKVARCVECANLKNSRGYGALEPPSLVDWVKVFKIN